MRYRSRTSSKKLFSQNMNGGPGSSPGKSDMELSNNELNHLYFYNGVNPQSVLEANQQLHAAILDSQYGAMLRKSPPMDIFFHVNSMGGFVMDGLNLMDTIVASPVPIVTVVEGIVASAATWLTIVGKKRLMKKNSCMMIHQLSSVMWGNFQQIEDEMLNMKLLMSKIKNIYKQYTKVPMKEIDEIMKHDILWDYDICLKYGLIDGEWTGY